MKKIFSVLLFLVVLVSCSKNSNVSETSGHYGKWILVKMSGSMPNSQTTGNDMQWQEFYNFNSDGTFVKSRTTTGLTIKSPGTFEVKNLQDGVYFVLNHQKESEIIGNCTGTLVEELILSEPNSLSNTWKNCDGPNLEYKK